MKAQSRYPMKEYLIYRLQMWREREENFELEDSDDETEKNGSLTKWKVKAQIWLS